MEYRYLNTRGWLNEGAGPSPGAAAAAQSLGALPSEPPPRGGGPETASAAASTGGTVLWSNPAPRSLRRHDPGRTGDAGAETVAFLDEDIANPLPELTEQLAFRYRIAPLNRDSKGTAVVAIEHGVDSSHAEAIVRLLARHIPGKVRVELVPSTVLEQILARAYPRHGDRTHRGHVPFDSDELVDFSQGVTSQTELFDPLRRHTGQDQRSHSGRDSIDPTRGASGVWFYTVEEGQRALMRRPNGTMEVVIGPRRIWKGQNTFTPMAHYVAHPGDFLIVRFRDGHQEHLTGPSEVWFDPRIHKEVVSQEGLQLAAKEAVVVYSTKEGSGQVQRRVVHGPALFIPHPGEWLHTFSWHASKGGSKGVVKVPNGLVFQKLWMMPDQMYHDVGDVRTADDAVLTIRLMIFFELVDINTMLDTTHDPIGDFVNAASSDVVDFVGRHDFERFKQHTDQLNEISTYKQLASRASQCGYRINKVVYRGYGAPEQLQQMHDQAIEARTKLQLARATERQSQELRDSKLENRLTRASKRREEQSREVDHEVRLKRTQLQAEIEERESRGVFERTQARLAAEEARTQAVADDARQREHLAALRDLGVDLTTLLTRGRPDRVIELRGAGPRTNTHLHVEPIEDGST